MRVIEICLNYQMEYSQTRICPRNGDVYNSQWLWDTKRTSKPGLKTRPSINKQEKNLSSCEFGCFSRPQSKNKRKLKNKQILESCQRSWLVALYGISTLIGYLILNPVYTYKYRLWTKCVGNIFKRARVNLFARSQMVFKHCSLTLMILLDTIQSFPHC